MGYEYYSDLTHFEKYCNSPQGSKVSFNPYGDYSYLLFHVQWGYVVVTTPNGVLDHEEAIRQNVGGQVVGYFY